MGEVLRLSLLATVVSTLSIAKVEDIANHDRIVVQCSEDRMVITVRKDYDKFSLRGDESECTPEFRNFTEYDDTVIKVKAWTLPLKYKSDGPCGLRFAKVKDSELWAHSTTVFGFDDKTAQCLQTGVLDKRGARIRLEQVNPLIGELVPTEGTVEVPKRSTLSAAFYHRFQQDAGLSLHPIQCWVVNERRNTRKLVVDAGCPVRNHANKTLVTLGSETASEATGDHPHVFFNADDGIFEDEDPSDLPSFRLQCTVIPCKGMPLNEQVIGVARCPSVAWCETDRRMTYHPADAFEINQEFSIIASSSSVSDKEYRELGMPIYPLDYTLDDTEERLNITKGESSCWMVSVVVGLLIVGFIVVLVVVVFRCLKKEPVREKIRKFVRRHVGDCDKCDRYKEKNSTLPLVEEDQAFALQQNL